MMLSKNYQKFWLLLSKKNKFNFILITILSVIASMMEVLSLGSIVTFFSAVLDPDRYKDSNLYNEIRFFFGNPSVELMKIYLVFLLIFIFLVKNLFLSFFSWMQILFSNNLRIDLAKRLYSSYLNSSYEFHLKSNSNILYRNVDHETLNISSAALKFITIILEVLVFTSLITVLLIYQPKATVIISVFLILICTAFYFLIGPKMKYWGKRKQFHSGEFLKHLFHGIHSIKDVIILNRQKSFVNLFSENQTEAIKFSRFEILVTILTRYWIEFITIFLLSLIILLMEFSNKSITEIIIVLSLFGGAAYRLAPSVNKIITSLNSFKFFLPSIDIVNFELNRLSSIKRENKIKPQLLKFKRDLSFENLSYKYPNSKKFVFQNSDFKIFKNTITGIYGKSGSGKTTLINIICNLLQPQSGNINIDGKKISFDQSWKLDIGYVSQSISLLDDTIEKNIAFGLSEKEINQEKLTRSIEISQVNDFIRLLPYGTKTTIGERGTRLSGGQLQRIGIARALYNNPEILIIDEGTNSLDEVTEKKIIDEIKLLKKEISIIIISHDMNLIRSASDHFFHISDGRIEKIESLNPSN